MAYKVDHLGRLGEVVEELGDTVRLRPVGGGAAWEVTRGQVREPNAAERARARVLSRPVGES
ncbi:hypothetical protein AB0B50_00110 [Streptomyces sp. NPDC041068]|uniref:hypothetical protein n=1 Tax=Streptomyces sp. NPDC041068 TaxID=3155130 RepID=UPI0033F42059